MLIAIYMNKSIYHSSHYKLGDLVPGCLSIQILSLCVNKIVEERKLVEGQFTVSMGKQDLN